MSVRLEKQIYDYEPRAANDRSFSLPYLVEKPPQTLGDITQDLATHSESVGMPSISISNAVDADLCKLTMTGSNSWQLLLRNEDQAALLDAKVTEYSEEWTLASPDEQGRWYREGVIDDPDNEITSFVLDAIHNSSVTSVTKVASDLEVLRLHLKKKLLASKAGAKAMDMYYAPDKVTKKLQAAYSETQFTPGLSFNLTERHRIWEADVDYLPVMSWVWNAIQVDPDAQLSVASQLLRESKKLQRATGYLRAA